MSVKGLNRVEVEKFVADLMMGFEGVAACMTASDISANQYTEAPKIKFRMVLILNVLAMFVFYYNLVGLAIGIEKGYYTWFRLEL